MAKIITSITLFICSLLTAQAQFEQGMGKAMELWNEGKTVEASTMFESIAAADKTSYLPNYYVALINTTTALKEKDNAKIDVLLGKPQSGFDNEMVKGQNSSEVHVLQELIYTARVLSDPMTSGITYAPQVMESYSKAKTIEPNNPRAIYGD